MNPIRRKITHCIFAIGTIILLAAAYLWFSQIRVQAKIDSDTLLDSVLFYYDDNYATTLSEGYDGIYYVYLPSFADASNIKVEIENTRVDFMTETDTISVYNLKKKTCSFETNKVYEMVFYDNKNNELAELEVIFMESANLPTLYISTESGSFEAIDEDKTYSEDAVFSFVTEDGKTQFSNVMAEISARGNHTFTFEKKSYQFDLSQECNLLNMGESKTWILLCNSYDLTNLRNKITYDMAVSAEMEGSPQAEFVDVYFNNVYHGTYLLSEKVEYGKNRLDYEDLESKNVAVNDLKLGEYETYSIDEGVKKGYLLPENPDDITGGYLVEHEYGLKYEEEFCGFITEGNERYVVKNPKHASAEEVDYISNLFQEIEDAIKSEDGYNKKTGKHYSEYIDMKSWADKYIVEEFCKNHGGGCTSSYYYKLSDEISEKVYGGPIWDYDKAYARNNGLSSTTNDLTFLTLHTSFTNWFYYLYQHEDFREMVYLEYQNAFAPFIESDMLAEIDYYADLLQPSLQLNYKRFEDMFTNHIEINMATYYEDVDTLKQFILARKETLDAMWIEEKEICTVYFAGSNENETNRNVTVQKGDVLQHVPKNWEEDGENLVWVDSETGELLTEGMVIDHDIVATLQEQQN